ncbi:YggT family protein [Leucobacter sp. 1207-22]|uniref:YggT family protein n=1 Tax=Leucobacter sp. 1207-22 TaxID=2604456 RepID=UPI004062FD04
MEILLILTTVVRTLLRIYVLFLWARLIIDWVVVLNPRFRPRGIVAVLVEFVFSMTDPPLKAIRKVLPPIRLGQVSIDMGWMIAMFVCWIALGIIPGYF